MLARYSLSSAFALFPERKRQFPILGSGYIYYIYIYEEKSSCAIIFARTTNEIQKPRISKGPALLLSLQLPCQGWGRLDILCLPTLFLPTASGFAHEPPGGGEMTFVLVRRGWVRRDRGLFCRDSYLFESLPAQRSSQDCREWGCTKGGARRRRA